MEIILTGIEYSGTSTLARAISAWYEKETGEIYGYHDHFKVPHVIHAALTEEEQRLVLALSPRIKEAMQRHNLEYHVQPTFFMTRRGNHRVEPLQHMPYLVQVLVKASPEVIASRLKENPHKHGLLKDGYEMLTEIKHVLERFDEVAAKSLIRTKITLDTSDSTVEETVAEFVEEMVRYMSTDELRRIAARRRGR